MFARWWVPASTICADRNLHEELGFHDGWGAVIRQLAELTEVRG